MSEKVGISLIENPPDLQPTVCALELAHSSQVLVCASFVVLAIGGVFTPVTVSL
jgi:hypothetical protein